MDSGQQPSACAGAGFAGMTNNGARHASPIQNRRMNMAMFVTPGSRVPVTLDGNTIYIKSKMDAGTKAAVENEISASRATDLKEMEISKLGAYSLALLTYNIVAWEGPAFLDEKGVPVPCNKLNISRLDLDEPLVEMVREEIGQRNRPKVSPNPN
jgi:hypothetical protein